MNGILGRIRVRPKSYHRRRPGLSVAEQSRRNQDEINKNKQRTRQNHRRYLRTPPDRAASAKISRQLNAVLLREKDLAGIRERALLGLVKNGSVHAVDHQNPVVVRKT